jgi:hypothetical protein
VIAQKDISRMRAICDAASPDPLTLNADKVSTWVRGPHLVAFFGHGGSPQGRADALFWIAARRAIPVLLGEIERLYAEIPPAERALGAG